MEDAMFIAKYANKLTVVHRRDEFRASKIMIERAAATPNIEFKTPYAPEEFVEGPSGKLESVRLVNTETGEKEEMAAGGAFVAIGHIPGSQLLTGQIDLHDNDYVKTFEPSTRTNLAGVFAVGDLVDFTYRQAVTAAGSGCRGALDAEWYLRDTPPTEEQAEAMAEVATAE
jgi:thioredoxin reductase (NADPH)